MALVDCPICEKPVKDSQINDHIDSGCASFVADPQTAGTSQSGSNTSSSTSTSTTSASASTAAAATPSAQKRSASSFFATPVAKRSLSDRRPIAPVVVQPALAVAGKKRSFEEALAGEDSKQERNQEAAATSSADHNHKGNEPPDADHADGRAPKKIKTLKAAPLAERMRPTTLDDIYGQELVGPHGVLRSLIDSGRVPSMILWGAAGTGKTTIARCIATAVGGRFIELNATSTGVAECKRLFAEAANDLALSGRRTILFCDEIHRFTKAQQDVFLRPVEAGTITLVGATTENPSFKIANALLSRCRTFTLRPLGVDDVMAILKRAREAEHAAHPPSEGRDGNDHDLINDEMLAYLARFSDGDARTALNLLELALSLSARPGITPTDIKQSLTKTLVYDRAGDQHYDTISAFHKSVRGSDPDAALYYLARMLQSGEDPLFVARRMVVIASEDVGLADNSLLPLATAAYTAAQQIGMPEARIPLAHCCVALCLAPKSTRAYRGLNNAFAALREPGVAGLPVPLHLRNAPTRMMREMGYGAEYKYPPNYRGGRVRQAYLPDELWDRKFLEERDLGTEVDPEYVERPSDLDSKGVSKASA